MRERDFLLCSSPSEAPRFFFCPFFVLFDRSETPSTSAIAAAMASKIPFGTLRGCGRIWDLVRVRDGKGCLGKENGLPKWFSFLCATEYFFFLLFLWVLYSDFRFSILLVGDSKTTFIFKSPIFICGHITNTAACFFPFFFVLLAKYCLYFFFLFHCNRLHPQESSTSNPFRSRRAPYRRLVAYNLLRDAL